MLKRIRTSLNFVKLTDGLIGPFAGAVINGLTAEAARFPALPVTVAQLTSRKEAYETALIAAQDAGTSETAAKDQARAALEDALRKNALYVEIAADNDLAVLLSSGYEAASTNRASAPLETVEVLAVQNASEGEIKARVKTQPNVKSYVGRCKPVGGSEFGPNLSFASSRAILFAGLTKGVTYVFQVCAVGGSTGQSDWSDPVEKMAV